MAIPAVERTHLGYYTTVPRNVLAAVVLLCLFAGGARAQIIETYLPEVTLATDSVLSRPRPEYAATGVRVGSFIVRPEVRESVGYDSNVYGQAGSPGSPRIDTSGTVQAASNWSRDAVGLFFNVDNIRTPSASVLSYTTVTAAATGSLDIGNDQLNAAYTYLSGSVPPNGIGGIGLEQNLPFVTNDVRVNYTANLARVAIIPDIKIDSFRFGQSVTNGIAQSKGYLDRDVYTPSVTARYEQAPGRALVFVVRGDSAQYLSAQPGQPRRNYLDVQVLGGIDFSADDVIRYGALVGYETRSYQSSEIKGASSPILEAQAVWTPTRLTTVTGTVTRRIEDAIEDNIYSYTYTELRGVVDHELRRDLLLEVYLDVQRANYAQNGGTQTLYGGGASVAWLLNRHVQLRASVALSDSIAPSPNNYTRNVFLLQLRFGL